MGALTRANERRSDHTDYLFSVLYSVRMSPKKALSNIAKFHCEKFIVSSAGRAYNTLWTEDAILAAGYIGRQIVVNDRVIAM